LMLRPQMHAYASAIGTTRQHRSVSVSKHDV
jgi:hypothetical protein